jgi:PAS domain S-box-containing protein
MGKEHGASRERLLQTLRMIRRRWQWVGAVAVLCVGVAISVVFFVSLRSEQQAGIRAEFERRSEERVAAISEALKRQPLELRSVRSFFEGSDEVTRKEFAVFVAPMVADHPKLRTLQWVPRVLEADRSACEASAVRDGLIGFQITERDRFGALVPAARRAEYFPLRYVEPCQSNVATLGFDLATDPACRTAMQCGRDTGELSLTSAVALSDESPDRLGVRMFYPVYDGRGPLKSDADRRAHLAGFVLGILRVNELVEDALSTLKPAGIDVCLADTTSSVKGSPLYKHRSRLAKKLDADVGEDASSPRPELTFMKTIDVAKRRWTVFCTPMADFVASRTSWYPWVASSASLSLTGLLVAYFVGIAVWNTRSAGLIERLSAVNQRLVREIADRKQADILAKSNQAKYHAIYESSADAIMYTSPESGMLNGNQAALALFGCKTQAEFTLRTPADFSPERQPDGTLSSIKAQEMMAIAAQKGMHLFEWLHKRIDGSEFFAEVLLTRTDLDGRPILLASVRDISEQTAAETRLHASERRLRLFAENVSDVIWTTDFSGKFTYMSPGVHSMLGITWRENAPVALADIMTPASLEVCREEIAAFTTLINSGQRPETRRLELEMVHAGGTTIWGEVSVSVLYDESGHPLGLSGVARNISDRKRAEELKARSLRRLEGVNRLQEDLLLASPLKEKFKKITEAAVGLLDLDFCRIWMVRNADLCANGCDHAEETDGRHVCTHRDRCLHLMASSGRYIHVNGGHRRVPLGAFKIGRIASGEDMKFLTNDVVHDPQVGDHKWAEDLGLVSFAGYKLRDADGAPIGVLAAFAKHPTDPEDDAFMSSLAETTSRVIMDFQAAEELRKTREKAIDANLAKSRFLANMSHEIRTPMTAILGYTDLLMDPSLTSSSRDNYLAVIRRSGEHLLSLINDILDLSKIEAGRLLLNPGRCSVVAILADVASVVRPRAQQRGVPLTVEYAGPMPASIESDAMRLRQALVNLGGNAAKFTERGRIRLVASFLPDWRGAPAVQIEIIDTGVGIRQDVLPKLFQPFSQGDSSVTNKFGGTGLGLAISRHIAQLLGGDLSVSSTLGRGSTFTLVVPTGSLDGVEMLESPSEVQQETPAKPAAWSSEALRGIRILLAEDGYDNRQLIQAVLRRVGAEVEAAENGRIAVEMATAESFDLILMDMNMPEMDGYEATRLLRADGWKGPIVALTANAMAGDRDQCCAAGCDDYLAKPIDRALLIHTISAFVDREDAGESSATPPDAAPNGMEADSPSVVVSLFANDPEMAEILKEFIGRLPGQFEEMQPPCAAHRHEDLQRVAHKLKGAGGCYGYPSLTETCRLLEDAARGKDIDAETTAIESIAALIKAIQSGYSATTLAGSNVP